MLFWDLLYHRYANPFLLLDNLILTDRLSDFVDVILKQKDEEMLWQLYLSDLIKEKSFNKWKESFRESACEQQSSAISKKEIEATVRKSEDILASFVPVECEVRNGTI